MYLGRVRTGLILYVLFDFLIGGYCGGFLPLSPAAAAQFTLVTGTVVDPNGIAYSNGTISAILVSSASPTLNGLAYTPPTQPVGLNGVGSFTLQLADTTVLLPSGSKWNFIVCSAIGTVNPAIGTGSQCFTLAAPITIFGSSQDISAQLNAAATKLTVTGVGGGVASVTGSAPITSTGGANPVIGCSTCATTNPTTGVIPVRTGVATFGDSPFSVSGGNAFITAAGQGIGIGTSTIAANTQLEVHGSAASPTFPTAGAFYSHITGLPAPVGTGNTGAPIFSLNFSRGTQAAPAAVQGGVGGDVLGEYAFGGYDGTTYFTGTSIESIVLETTTWTATKHGSALQFYTTKLGQTNRSEVFRMGQTNGTSNDNISNLDLAANDQHVIGWPFGAGPQLDTGFSREQGAGGSGKIDVGNGTLNDKSASMFLTLVGLVESAAPSGVASTDLLWGDSTAHRFKMNNNSGGAQVVAANPMSVLGDVMYGGTVTGGVAAETRLAGPTTPNGVPQYLVETPSGGVATALVFALAGVPTNPQTGASYTYLATDRASYVSFSNAGAIAVTLPQAGSAGFASNFVNVSCDIGAGTATITPTTSTISYTTGSAYTSGAATLALTTGQCAWIYSDNTNYFAIVRGGGGSGAPGGVVISKKTASYTTVTGDFSSSTTAPSQIIFTLAGTAQAATLAGTAPASGACVIIENSLASAPFLLGIVTGGATTLDGTAYTTAATSPALGPGQSAWYCSDGTNYFTQSGRAVPLVLTSAVGGFCMADETCSAPTTNAAPSATANQVVVSLRTTHGTYKVSNFTLDVIAGAAGTADYGIYDSSGNQLVHINNGFSTTAAGFQTVAANAAITLPPGTYYMAVCSSTNTATLLMTTEDIRLSSGPAHTQGTAANACTAGVLPATLGTVTNATATPNGWPNAYVTP